MTRRTRQYMQRQKAQKDRLHFTDMASFLKATFHLSGSLIVKRDALRILFELRQQEIAA